MLWSKIIGAGGTGGVAGLDYNIASATHESFFSVAGQDTIPGQLFFKSDGASMYVVGGLGDDLLQYDLSVAWDTSTSSFVQAKSVAAQEGAPSGLAFDPTGSHMFVCGIIGDEVNQYSLSTAWDISTASPVRVYSVATRSLSPRNISFSPDGVFMFITDNGATALGQYTLSTAWDISTALFTREFDTSVVDGQVYSAFFNPNGNQFFLGGWNNRKVYAFTMSSSWNISTATFSHELSISEFEIKPIGIFIKPDGSKLYISGQDGDGVDEFNL